MPEYIDDYIDLLASGDEQKIKCVLMTTGAMAATGGIIGSATFIGAAPGAILGMLSGFIAAHRMCGVESAEGSFENLFRTTSLPRSAVNDYERNLMSEYGIRAEDARQISKLAFVYLRSGGRAATRSLPYAERKITINRLLEKSKYEFA